MTRLVAQFVRDDSGQDLIEYVLLGSFVSLAAYTTANTLGGNLSGWYNQVALWVAGASGQVPAAP
jgi:Flp pilus assembly pilin Flp